MEVWEEGPAGNGSKGMFLGAAHFSGPDYVAFFEGTDPVEKSFPLGPGKGPKGKAVPVGRVLPNACLLLATTGLSQSSPHARRDEEDAAVRGEDNRKMAAERAAKEREIQRKEEERAAREQREKEMAEELLARRAEEKRLREEAKAEAEEGEVTTPELAAKEGGEEGGKEDGGGGGEQREQNDGETNDDLDATINGESGSGNGSIGEDGSRGDGEAGDAERAKIDLLHDTNVAHQDEHGSSSTNIVSGVEETAVVLRTEDDARTGAVGGEQGAAGDSEA